MEEAKLLTNKKKPPAPRSLTNPTGTACHLASALLLLHHCLAPIRWTVLALANHHRCDKTNTDFALLHQLACLLRTLEDEVDEGTANTVDPTLVYRQVPATIGVEPHMLGDAVTALVKILQYLRSITAEVATATDNNIIDLMSVWDDWVDAGKVHSVLEGTACTRTIHDDCDNDNSMKHILRKEANLRPMPVPFSVTVSTKEDGDDDSSTYPSACHSLPDLVRQHVLAPQVVDGYQWRQSSADENEDDSSDMSIIHNVRWKTTKSLQIDALSPIWMIHLDRFQWNREDRRIQANEASIEIPLVWTPDFVNRTNHSTNDDNNAKPSSFHLMGGIVHVEDLEERTNDSRDNEEEGGHYVCLVRQNSTSWFLLDDDQEAQEVPTEQALQLLGGSDKYAIRASEPTCIMRGVLLVYHQDSIECKLSSLQEQIERLGSLTRIDWTRPTSLIGSRLRVKWSKDKYYAGVVSAYDSQTGKHQVTYDDDADVRWYNLRKKTIEWE